MTAIRAINSSITRPLWLDAPSDACWTPAGCLPDASRMPARRLPNALKPGIHGVRAHWIRGFMAFWLVRRIRAVMLMVPACPESGSLGRAARPRPAS
jgi:hypothetical protein